MNQNLRTRKKLLWGKWNEKKADTILERVLTVRLPAVGVFGAACGHSFVFVA